MNLENIKKIFVPDTNIAIDDTYFMKDFLKDKENAVVIPDVVIAEIDKLKKSSEVGLEARLFSNYLYKLTSKGYNDTEGINIFLEEEKTEGGKFFISNKYSLENLVYKTDIGKNDLQIISLAKKIKEEHPKKEVKIVSNDKNLILVARLNKIEAEYLKKDSANPEKLSKGYRIIENIPKSLLNDIVRNPDLIIPLKDINESWTEELIANEYVIFPNEEVSKKIKKTRNKNDNEPFSVEPRFIKRYDILSDSLVPIEYKNTPLYGFKARNLEQMLLIDLLLNNNIHIKVVSAEAGTGKSFLQLLVALYKTIERRKHNKEDAKVLIIRRSSFLEEYGYLPGDIIDKNKSTYEGVENNYNKIMKAFSDYNKSIKDSYSIKFSDALKEEDGLIQILPFGTIRGVTVGPNSILIGEEWENTEIKFSKIMMDRNSDGEVYINGDIMQTDNPHTSPERNGLTYIIKSIEETTRKARKSRDKISLYDASIAGIVTLVETERGIINAWSKRNLKIRGYR
ncbi:MAG: PIN domain-containing protein [Candidatus Woesearchaeota archaeon]